MTLIDARDKREAVSIDLGDTIYVRVEENPTTGYRWSVDEFDADLLQQEGSDFKLPPDAGVGAAGQRTFTFRATRRGRGRMALKLWREWQGPTSVIDRRDITVTVD
jgi:inhibitor of cysteine peptidase